MADFFISFLVLALFVITLLSLFAVSVGWKAKPNPLTGEIILRSSLPFRIVAVVGGFVFPVVVLVILIVIPPVGPNVMLASELGLFGFKLLGLLCIQQNLRTWVILSSDGLTRVSPWRRPVAIAWSEIVRVKCECPKSWFVFETADGRRIDIPLMYEGLSQLVAMIQLKLAPNVFAPAVPGFRLSLKR